MEELALKTNRLDLNLRRPGAADIASRIAAFNECVASIRLSDHLSESGDIGLAVGKL